MGILRESSPSSGGSDGTTWLIMSVFMLLLFVALLLQTAWLSDDAYITFRTIDNFVNGYGLRWNIGERAQSYTHPLWLMVLSIPYALTREIYYTSILVSIFLSIGSALIVLRLALTKQMAVVGLAILVSSRAFIDFTTSGLEAPLSFFLAAIFFHLWFTQGTTQKNLILLSLVGALAALNRLDTLLIYGPPVLLIAWELWRSGSPIRRIVALMVAGGTPLLLWLVFSTVYYGFPFPNTYYAKLWTGVDPVELFIQGLRYAQNSLLQDAVTLLTIIAVGLLVAIRGDARARMAVAGIALYCLYTLKIGGDFMSGRFFALPLFVAVLVLVRQPIRSQVARVILITSFVVGLLVPRPALLYFIQSPEAVKPQGVADERGFYYPYSGLFRLDKDRPLMFVDDFVQAAEEDRAKEKSANELLVTSKQNVGYYGYYVGPDVHVIDELGLTDPLLARLALRYPDFWRAGHYLRAIPDGYEASIITGENLVADPAIAELYADIKLITQGPLFTSKRFSAIWRQNVGRRAPPVTEP